MTIFLWVFFAASAIVVVVLIIVRAVLGVYIDALEAMDSAEERDLL